ncbi:Heterotrimeric G-protein alpha subunit [Mycena sanguinolenta]|uniref:Heterotrimeric G-protein alpha subunit n=1 Tax=Mycena sanguinolenta TaxID=230812 RepID=A0A8H7D9R4_9AGAR|nr:Heterotrimeric G-protein alpha subunit [Mycena sanguinolenta]
MGACASQSNRASKLRSDEIDRQLEEDSKRYRKECRILLLGSGESGKSTIVKQVKIIYQSGFTKEERLAYRKTIHKNVLDSAQALVEAIRKYGIEDLLRDKLVCERILPAADGESTADGESMQGRLTPGGNEVQAGDGQEGLGRELANAIEVLWRDPVVARLLDKHQSEFYLMDSAAYFLTDISRLSHPSYVPTEEDVLRARAQSTAITETRFNVGNNLSIHMFDVGGQRTERRKWIHCFERSAQHDEPHILHRAQRVRPGAVGGEGTGAFPFSPFTFPPPCIPLPALTTACANPSSSSRASSTPPWFLRTAIILFLNKLDVFRVKVAKIPLQRYFPEYTGGSDIREAAKFILWRFMQQNHARLSVYP